MGTCCFSRCFPAEEVQLVMLLLLYLVAAKLCIMVQDEVMILLQVELPRGEKKSVSLLLRLIALLMLHVRPGLYAQKQCELWLNAIAQQQSGENSSTIVRYCTHM